MSCNLCPRNCNVNREDAEGFCGAEKIPHIARAALHGWEETCISGTMGSGAIFFCGCNMDCVFCQNHTINHAHVGQAADAGTLARIMLRLQEKGAHNINLVTPTPHVDTIIPAVVMAKREGLFIPIVYNTNAYETEGTLDRLNGIVDIYLPDLKYADAKLSAMYSKTEDYFQFASRAIMAMHEQCGALQLNDVGIATRGLLIRHLVLPASLYDTRRVLDFIADHLPLSTYISLMSQYVPYRTMEFSHLNRRLTAREYARAVDYCILKGFHRVYMQELASAKPQFTPIFNGETVMD